MKCSCSVSGVYSDFKIVLERHVRGIDRRVHGIGEKSACNSYWSILRRVCGVSNQR